MSSYVVLGSGWLGHYFVPKLAAGNPSSEITAVYRTQAPLFKAPNIKTTQSTDLIKTVESQPASHVIHLGRGETDADFKVHQTLIELQNTRGMRYFYASSANAVDFDTSKTHLESDLPNAKSDYGKFKGKCENEMTARCDRPVMFRFTATHGWAPNRIARTEDFLKKLNSGQPIEVQKGILQNRTFIGDLANQLLLLTQDESLNGLFHFGTSDSSEESDFLKRLATGFGYDPSQVVETAFVEPWNMVMKVDRIPAAFPKYPLPTEADTISAVTRQPELSKYLRS